MNEQEFKQKAGILVNHYNSKNYLYVIKETQVLLKKCLIILLLNLLGSAFQNINELGNAKDCFYKLLKLIQKMYATTT